jgi:putative transposase
MKKEHQWLKEVDSTSLQASLRNLDFAYKNFFRRVRSGEKPGFPKWKSRKDNRKSYRSKLVGKNIEVLEKHVKLPKLGLVKASISKQVQGRILNATVSQSPSGKYYVSVCCTDVPTERGSSTGAVIGIDLGITTLATTSDVDVEFKNNSFLKKSAKKLSGLQRSLSRKSKGSRNRNKARIKVARMQEKIANQRLDSIHKMTSKLIKDYDLICIEDLNIRGMVRNRKLSKHISDASWGEIERQLRYKSEWKDKKLLQVDRYFPSSQLCVCGYKNTDVKDLSVRIWKCPECKTINDRDVNAASNILSEGLRILSVA